MGVRAGFDEEERRYIRASFSPGDLVMIIGRERRACN